MRSCETSANMAQMSLLVLSAATIAAAAAVPTHVPIYDTTVPSPTNVTLQCHNFQNTLYWNYSQPSLQPQFQITIFKTTGREEHKNVTLPNHRFDLSLLCDPKQEYTVNVLAVVQGRKSMPEPVNGLSFTYYSEHQHSTQNIIICKLVLPPVKVTIQNGSILNIAFFHPLKVHAKGETLNWKNNPFSYLIQAKGQNKSQQLNCRDEVCTVTVEVLGDPENHCVKIKGICNSIAVEATQEYYCTQRKLDLQTVTQNNVTQCDPEKESHCVKINGELPTRHHWIDIPVFFVWLLFLFALWSWYKSRTSGTSEHPLTNTERPNVKDAGDESTLSDVSPK